MERNFAAFPGGSPPGVIQLKYTAGEVAGTEKIIARLPGSDSSVETSITAKVPDLYSMGGSGSYRLTGQTPMHSSNHYGTWQTLTNTSLVADDFYEQFQATLGINDISLEWGGLFDISGAWSSPHVSHRKGTGVDIDRCALSTIPDNSTPRTCVTSYDRNGNPVWHSCESGSICVPRKTIDEICLDHGAIRMERESTHHCEFPR